jgi:hypothetical protein
MAEDNITRLYQIAKSQAVTAAGGRTAWQVIGPDLRRALASKEVLNLLWCQDNSISAETVVALLDGLINKLSEDAEFYG